MIEKSDQNSFLAVDHSILGQPPVKLNRLEKLGYIQSADVWQNIRVTRNKFTHDYPDDWDRNSALINLAREAAAEMYEILARVEQKLKIEHPALVLGKPLSVQI